MPDDTSHPPSPTHRPATSMSPEPVVLVTDSCIGLLRNTKLTAETVTSMRNAVAEDLRVLHTRVTAVSDAVSDRFENAERRLATIEGKFNEFTAARTKVLAAVDLSKNPLTSTLSGSRPTSDTDATPLVTPPTARRNNIPTPLVLGTNDNTPVVDPFGNETPRPANLFSQEPPGAPLRPNTARKSESFYVNVMSMKMPLNIPTFSGASHENFASFIRSFTDHANASKDQLTPDVKLSVLLTYLTDFARDKAQELMDTKQEASFDDVVTYLKSTFQDPIRAETERQQLRQCTQRPDESVDAFSTRVRKLAQSAYLDKSRDYIADKAKEAFVDGLTFNLKFHVKGASPATFQEAQNAAMKFELLLAEAAKANTVAPQGLAVEPAIQEFPQQPSHSRFKTGIICFRCGYEGHYKNQCWRFQYQHQNNFQNHGPRPQYSDSLRQSPTDTQITSDQQQYNNHCVNSLTPRQDPLVEQLRSELQANQTQLDALIKRNSELSAAVTSAPPSRRINVLSAVPRLGSLLTLFTLIVLCCPSSASTPPICKPQSPEIYLQLPSPMGCSSVTHLNASTNSSASATLSAVRKPTDNRHNEIWEAMQGSLEFTCCTFSTRRDPITGPLTVAGVEEPISSWERYKFIAEIVFVEWSIIMTVLVGIAIICRVAKCYVGPWLVSVWAKARNSVPTSSEALNVRRHVLNGVTSPDLEAGLPTYARRIIAPVPIPDDLNHSTAEISVRSSSIISQPNQPKRCI